MIEEIDLIEKFGLQSIVGQEILTCELIDCGDEELVMNFKNGMRIGISDNDSQCCESRYITTDDNSRDLIGNKLIAIKLKEGLDLEDDVYKDSHETMFLEIRTNNGFVTFVTHNVHSGAYGGFDIKIRIIKEALK